MKLSVRWSLCLLATWLVAGVCGCVPAGSGPSDEEKEPYYLEGKSLVNSLDYRGAIEAFKKALRADPDNSAAHFELALLYNDKEPDPAAAIYHYQRFLELRPNYEQANLVRQRIENCRIELARNVILPASPALQQDLEQMAEENKRLREENQKLQGLLASRAAVTNYVPSAPPGAGRVFNTPPSAPQPNSAPSSLAENGRGAPPNASARTHTVKSGETPSAIARQYGVKLATLMAANPGVDARRLQVGQTLNIPNQ
jgi:LysM repeat protein